MSVGALGGLTLLLSELAAFVVAEAGQVHVEMIHQIVAESLIWLLPHEVGWICAEDLLVHV